MRQVFRSSTDRSAHVTGGAEVDALSSLIATQRQQLGLSLRQLGEASGISFTWLSRLENGQGQVLPSTKALIGLASSLQLSVAELLIRSGVDVDVVLPPDGRVAELRAEHALPPATPGTGVTAEAQP